MLRDVLADPRLIDLVLSNKANSPSSCTPTLDKLREAHGEFVRLGAQGLSYAIDQHLPWFTSLASTFMHESILAWLNFEHMQRLEVWGILESTRGRRYQRLAIRGCSLFVDEHLTSMVDASMLTVLSFSNCEHLALQPEVWHHLAAAAPCLREVQLVQLPAFHGIYPQSVVRSLSFPSWERLEIVSCPAARKLSFSAPHLASVVIRWCPLLDKIRVTAPLSRNDLRSASASSGTSARSPSAASQRMKKEEEKREEWLKK